MRKKRSKKLFELFYVDKIFNVWKENCDTLIARVFIEIFENSRVNNWGLSVELFLQYLTEIKENKLE